MRDAVTLKVSGNAYEGWEKVTIQRSLMALCGAFEVSLADLKTGRDWRFATQEDCTLSIGSDRVLTGFIDRVSLDLGAESHAVTIAGRDLTADLVDCAAVADAKGTPFPGTLKKTDLHGLAKTLLKPFGMSPASDHSAGLAEPFRQFAFQRGETVFEALDRACKLRGVIVTTDPWGRLHLTATAATRAAGALRYGVNVTGARVGYDYTNRFRHYRVETQVAGEGKVKGEGGSTVPVWGAAVNVWGTFEDKAVIRFRPTILSADADATRAAAKKRAASEALYRAAASHAFEVDVAGWRQADGTLWTVNQVVAVDIPPLYLKEDLLVVEVRYQQSRDEGTTTALKLMRQDAFDTARAMEAQAIHDPRGVQTRWPKGAK